MKNILIGIFVWLCFLTKVHGQSTIKIYQVDALDKVLKDRLMFIDQMDTIRVARGEYASVQFVVRSSESLKNIKAGVEEVKSENDLLKPSQIGFVGYVGVGRKTPAPGRDHIISPSGFFPDPIYTDTTLNIEQGEPQPIWVTIPIRKDAAPGLI